MGNTARYLFLMVGLMAAWVTSPAFGQASRMPSQGSARKPPYYMGPYGVVPPGSRSVEPPVAPEPSPIPTPSPSGPSAAPLPDRAPTGAARTAVARTVGGLVRRARGSTSRYPQSVRWETWWEWNKERYLGLGHRPRTWLPGSESARPFLGRGGSAVESRRERMARWARILPVLCRESRQGMVALRVASVYALGFLGEPGVIRDLVVALSDHDTGVRETALMALGMTGEPEAVGLLLTVLKGERPGTGDQLVCRATDRERGLAALSLGLIGDAEAIEPLHQLAFRRTTQREVRGCALLGLGLIPDSESRALLNRALNASWCGITERALVATALGYQADEETLAPLHRLLRDRSTEVRRAAALAVGAFPRQAVLRADLRNAETRLKYGENLSPLARQKLAEFIARLEDALDVRCKEEYRVWKRMRQAVRQLAERDADQAVRAFGIVALGQIGEPADAEFLIRRLADDEVYEQRGFAALALGLLARNHETAATECSKALRSELARTTEPGLRGALFVGMGLAGDQSCGQTLARSLKRNVAPILRGYAATGLGLSGDGRHAGAVAQSLVQARDIVEIQNTALGLGLIGGPAEVKSLTRVLLTTESTVEQIAAGVGLAFLGGEKVLDTLSRFVATERKPATSRAFVAEGMGLALDVRDPTPLARITTGYDWLLQLGPVEQVASIKW